MLYKRAISASLVIVIIVRIVVFNFDFSWSRSRWLFFIFIFNLDLFSWLRLLVLLDIVTHYWVFLSAYIQFDLIIFTCIVYQEFRLYIFRTLADLRPSLHWLDGWAVTWELRWKLRRGIRVWHLSDSPAHGLLAASHSGAMAATFLKTRMELRNEERRLSLSRAASAKA